MKDEQTVVERIFELLETDKLENVLQLKDVLLKLEKIDLKLAYEKGALAAMYKSAILNGK